MDEDKKCWGWRCVHWNRSQEDAIGPCDGVCTVSEYTEHHRSDLECLHPESREGEKTDEEKLSTEITPLRAQVATLTAEVERLKKEQGRGVVERLREGAENVVAEFEVIEGEVKMRSGEELRLRASSADPARVERAAKAIFVTKYKLEGADEPDRAWKSEAPWDTDAEHTLCEWERDEYRQAARAALAAADGEEP